MWYNCTVGSSYYLPSTRVGTNRRNFLEENKVPDEIKEKKTFYKTSHGHMHHRIEPGRCQLKTSRGDRAKGDMSCERKCSYT